MLRWRRCFTYLAFGVATMMPAGASVTGLMIAGPHFAEGKVLALAYAYQQATDWHKRVPDLTLSTPVPELVEPVK